MQLVNTALLSFGLSGRVFHVPFIHAYPRFRLQGYRERSTRSIGTTHPSVQRCDRRENSLADPAIDFVAVNTMSIIDAVFTED